MAASHSDSSDFGVSRSIPGAMSAARASLRTSIAHHLMRGNGMVSNPRIEYKSEFSNLV